MGYCVTCGRPFPLGAVHNCRAGGYCPACCAYWSGPHVCISNPAVWPCTFPLSPDEGASGGSSAEKVRVIGIGSIVPLDIDHHRESAGPNGLTLTLAPERDTVEIDIAAPLGHGYGSDRDGDTEELWIAVYVSESDLFRAVDALREQAKKDPHGAG